MSGLKCELYCIRSGIRILLGVPALMFLRAMDINIYIFRTMICIHLAGWVIMTVHAGSNVTVWCVYIHCSINQGDT